MTKDNKIIFELAEDYQYVISHIGKENIFGNRDYIIMIRGLCISPAICDGKYAGEYSYDYPCDVTRFTLEQAEVIAKNNSDFEVVHWQNACIRVKNNLRAAIDILKKGIENV